MKCLKPNPKTGHKGQPDEINSFEEWNGMHTLEVSQNKNRVPLPWCKEAVNGIKSGSDTGFIPYSATKKNTGLCVILENNGYWISCKFTLLPFCGTGVVTYKHFSFPVDSFRHCHLVALEGHCKWKGPPVSWSQSSSLLLLLSHCQHVTFLPAGGFSASNVWKPVVHTLQSCAGAFLSSVTGTPASGFLELPCHPACHLKTMAPQQIASTHPLQWDLHLSLAGRERALPSLSLPWVLRSISSGWSLQLLVLYSLEMSWTLLVVH